MIRRIMKILCLLSAITFLNACHGYEDITLAVSNVTSLTLKEASYHSVVWVNNDLIAFRYSPTPQQDSEGVQVLLYDLSLKQEQLIGLPIEEEHDNCRKAGVHTLERLPNGNLGFIERCFFGNKVTGESYTLFVWEVKEQTISIMYEYPAYFRAWAFSFAPDMSTFVQEQAVGPELNNEIYLFDKDGNKEQLVSDFLRARSPAWSPDGSKIAFLGTESHNGKITSLGDTENLLYRPWDLYLMNANGENLYLVLSGIQFANDLKWLAQMNQLSFSGVFQGKEGIWIFDLATEDIIRVWPYRTSYDWSQDGTRIVLIANEIEEQKYPHPVIAEMPENLFIETP